MSMTKKEIYERVVQLTSELAQTKVAEKIFNAVAEEDAEKVQFIIDAFPLYYPELNQKIVSFGQELNKLVGNSEEDNENWEIMQGYSAALMQAIAETNIITKIAKATEIRDLPRLKEVIDDFRMKESGLVENLMNFEEEFKKYREGCKTGLEGSIFGIEADEDNGVFVFDTNIIDPLSFYVLTIFGNISDVYFFWTDCEEDDEGDERYIISSKPFIDAIQDATNEAFAEFVSCYNLVDWRGEETVGEILVAAFTDEFEEVEEVE